MKYNDLQVKNNKKSKRAGRGIAAGLGKTAGRGTKGQKARTGYSRRPGFAGGQNPLMQQLPKLPGFRSYNKKAANVFTDQLQKLDESSVTAETLAAKGLIAHPYQQVKLLKRGELKNKVNVSLPAASASAIAVLESAGGSFTKGDRIYRHAKKVNAGDPTKADK